jgi:hypothetical protein
MILHVILYEHLRFYGRGKKKKNRMKQKNDKKEGISLAAATPLVDPRLEVR